MEAGVCEAFSLVFAKESAIAQQNVVDFIARAFSIETVPL